MSQFFQDLWESIFTPGPTPSLLIATNISFACLQVVLALLLAATSSVHFIILSVLSAGLWWSINWFARELKTAQAREVRDQDAAAERKIRERVAGSSAGSDDSETEVETTAESAASPAPAPGLGQRRPAAGSSKEVEAVERKGELKQRGSAPVATTMEAPAAPKSAVSTEDEWEKVSESEKDK